jgi:hypothetical protein
MTRPQRRLLWASCFVTGAVLAGTSMQAFDALGSFALLPIGYGIVGWATEAFGAPLICVLGGAITVVLAMLGFTHPAVRNLD